MLFHNSAKHTRRICDAILSLQYSGWRQGLYFIYKLNKGEGKYSKVLAQSSRLLFSVDFETQLGAVWYWWRFKAFFAAAFESYDRSSLSTTTCRLDQTASSSRTSLCVLARWKWLLETHLCALNEAMPSPVSFLGNADISLTHTLTGISSSHAYI